MQVNIISDTVQEFNGERFYMSGKYFSHHNRRLHRIVYAYHHGKIPKGKCVHHKDHDRSNNKIDNLDIMGGREHTSYHSKLQDHTAWQEAMHKGANKWHGSPAGLAWHKKHYEECKGVLHQNIKRICLFCGNDFMGRSYAKYCSKSCASKYRYRKIKRDVPAICVFCGKDFFTFKIQPADHCSRSCAIKHVRRMRKERESSFQ